MRFRFRLLVHIAVQFPLIAILAIVTATNASAQNDRREISQQKINPPQAGACATGPCVPTYHNDPMRNGVNSNESALKPSLFPSQSNSNFGLLKPASGGATGAVDGLVYAQPLYLSGVAMGAGCSGTQNIVLVATENNSVYAFTWTYSLTATGYTFSLTQCWMLNLNQSGEYAIPFTALPVAYKGVPCNTQVPQNGISGTPVVDTSVTPPMMYVVSAHQTASLTYTYRLHAINIASGAEIINGSSAPYDLSSVFPTGLGAKQINQRPGLAMFTPAGGGTANLYIGFGSYCDIGPYSGYVAGLTYNYSTSSFAPVGSTWVFDTEAGARNQGGGIWMSGAAPAVDTAGNVYVAVANGDWNGTKQFGESVVQLATTTSGLLPVDYYTPNDYAALNVDLVGAALCSSYGSSGCPSDSLLTIPPGGSDFDLGSGGVTLISPAGVTTPPCGSNGELVAGGKEGVVYGVCYNPQVATTGQAMGGLDGCGYNCTSNSNPSLSACTESSAPGNGSIAQCFQGLNAGENQSNGSNEIFVSSGIRGTQAFWAGASKTPENYLYVAGTTAPMEAFQANLSTGLFGAGVAERAPQSFNYPGPVPAISWDGVHPATALLWAIDSSGYGQWHPLTESAQAAKPAALIVYNPIPITGTSPGLRQLWSSAINPANAGPGAVKFTVPTIAGGLVFVAGGTPGYSPGLPGGANVNCTGSALVSSATPTVCGGMLAVYGKIHE